MYRTHPDITNMFVSAQGVSALPEPVFLPSRCRENRSCETEMDIWQSETETL